MKQATVVLVVVVLVAGLVSAQYGPPPTKGKKHRTTTTTTEPPGGPVSNEISGPPPFPDSGTYTFTSSSAGPAGSPNLPGSTYVTSTNYWWQQGDARPFQPGSQPTGGCGGSSGCGPVPPPPPPPPSGGGCGGPAGCTGLGTDPRPSPAEPPSKPVDISQNPFLSSAILGKPIQSSPQGCGGAGGSCQYPSGQGSSPTQFPGAPTGTGQYPGAPGQPGSGYPSQGVGPTQYPGAPGSPGQPGSGYPSQGTGPTQFPGATTGGQYPGAPGSPTEPGSGYPSQGTGPTQFPGSSTGPGKYPGAPGSPGQPGSGYPSQGVGPTQYPGQPAGSSPFAGKTPGPTQYPQGQYPGQPSAPGSGVSGPGSVPLRPQCTQPGTACVPSSMCVGGYITPNGMRQMRDPQVKECIPGLEACCKLPPPPPAQGGVTPPPPGYGSGTQGPYTGPLNTTPHPGCAAALKCVEETYCTAEGVMSDTPVFLTRDQADNRVPLTDCQNPDNGIIGKCCRDPNYKDPWPAGMMMMTGPGGFDDGQYHGEGSGPSVNIGPSYNSISSTPQTPGKDHGPKPSQGPGGFNKPFPPPFPGNNPSSAAYAPGKQPSGTYQPGKPTPTGSYQPGQPAGTPYKPGQPSPTGSYQPGQPTPTGTSYQPGQPRPSGTPYQPGQSSPTGTYQPGQPTPTGSSYQPGQPSPSGTPYQPGQPTPTGTSYQPGQPRPSGTPYQPGQPSPTGSYQPGQPTPTGTSYQPGQPSPSGTPYQPGQPTPTGSYQPGQPTPTGTSYQPGQPSPSGTPYQPGQPTPTGTSYQPGQPSPSGTPYQPGQPSPTGSYQPGQPSGTPYQPGQPTPSGSPSQPGYNIPTHPGQNQPSGSGPVEGPAPGSSCGIRRPGPAGDVAGFAEFPWQALIVSAGNRSLLCGAAIISENAVITAAHCVNQLVARDLLVKAGEWKLLGQNPKPVQVRPAVSIARHPGYDSGSLAKDLAIIIVGEPFIFDVHVDKICIPPELGSEYFQKPGQNCLITGWGKNALQGPVQNSDLHKVDVDVIPAKQCEAKLKTSQNLGKYFILNEGFSCALPPSPTDLCKVDFGSAVACERGDGHYELAGVNSWDIACPTKQPLPSVFATSDAQWINTILSTPLPVLQAQEETYVQGLNKGESVDGVDIDDKPGFSQGYGK